MEQEFSIPELTQLLVKVTESEMRSVELEQQSLHPYCGHRSHGLDFDDDAEVDVAAAQQPF